MSAIGPSLSVVSSGGRLDESLLSLRLLRVEAPRLFGRFHKLTPMVVGRDVHRAWQLGRHAPVRPPSVPRTERLVVTLTTIPSRVSSLMLTLHSLLDQSCPPDRIIVAWPETHQRTGAPYPRPQLPDGVEALACPDEGPATKILFALRAEPRAVLVVVDDDVIYPRDFLRTLMEAHREDPSAAIGWRGWQLRSGVDPRDLNHVFATALVQPLEVDVLLGTWGYLVPPGALDDSVHRFDGWPNAVRWVDDVWISGHLARRGVRRKILVGRGLPIETRASRMDALTDGINRSGANDRAAIEAFRAWW